MSTGALYIHNLGIFVTILCLGSSLIISLITCKCTLYTVPLNDQWSGCRGLRDSEGNLLLCVLSELEAVLVQRHRAVATLAIVLGDLHGDIKLTHQLIRGQRREGLVGGLQINKNMLKILRNLVRDRGEKIGKFYVRSYFTCS